MLKFRQAAPETLLLGVGLVIAALACFATLDTTSKWLSGAMPVATAMAFRYLFQALTSTLLIVPRQGLVALRTQRLGMHILRGVLLVSASGLTFICLRFMPVGEFTAILLITPVVVTLLAARILGERVGLMRKSLVVASFIATLVIVRPIGLDFNGMLLLPLGAVAVNVSFQLLTSWMSREENPMTMQFYTGWVGAAVGFAAMPWFWQAPAEWKYWVALLFMSVMGAIGHFCLIKAFQKTEASQLMPFMYLQIVFAMLGGWLVFSHVADRWALVGIGLIAACGVASAWLNRKEAKDRLLIGS